MRQTNLEGYLEIVIAFSWCCSSASRGVWIAENTVEREVLESGEGETEEVAESEERWGFFGQSWSRWEDGIESTYREWHCSLLRSLGDCTRGAWCGRSHWQALGNPMIATTYSRRNRSEAGAADLIETPTREIRELGMGRGDCYETMFREKENMSLVGMLRGIGKCFDKGQMNIELCLIPGRCWIMTTSTARGLLLLLTFPCALATMI